MTNYAVILDACVLYPAPIRSYLLYLAQTGLYRARWTEQIHDEWIRNLLSNNQQLDRAKIERTKQLMNKHNPDCLIEGYEPLIESISLPDLNDRHVLAAAIRGQAEAIITYNLKDFPAEALSCFGVSAIHPDEFLSDMFELNPSLAIQAAHRHRRGLKNPPLSADDYLDCLQKQKLPNFVSLLRDIKFAI
ncbi:PIN domain-containing protein [Marinospirillum insulare]|uniref:PIN domain-containing protein n=1 Tax=Marinospirillum insulare TaxID=217169 RepID=A0ABQ5ZWT4_9GAMM|nr:PIN domain-containing protein [Marinospirillum insulare]GLR64626.1 hypothetical protein GCM10007878_20640 [Marinospirillum insulare]